MKNNMYESIRMTLKEWDSSDIIDAAFNAAEAYGEEPDWSEIIDTVLDKIPKDKFKKYLKSIGMTEDEFYDSIYESDPDSVISDLEPYLTKKDIKDICSMYEVEDQEEYDEEYD